MIKLKKAIIDTFQKQHIHFLLIISCVVMQMFTVGVAYRTFAYLNLLMVITSLYTFSKVDDGMLPNLTWLRNIAFYPICFVLLHFIAQQDVVMLKKMRHILLAVCLAIGVVMLSSKCSQYLKSKLYWIVALVILIYVIGQLIAIYCYDKPYGTTKNPHYLAFYCVISLIISVFCFFKGNHYYKFFFGICVLFLGFFLLNTGSRPAWLGLLFSAFVVIAFFLDKKIKLQAFLGLFVLLFMLFLTNFEGFSDRSKDLLQSINTEERVTIWRDTWTMQSDSSEFEWVVGHGMDAFEEDFKPYSTYHLQQVDFNSPHNYFLEILYISGLLGLALFLTLLWSFYKKIISCILAHDEHKGVYIMLFSIFTTCFIFAGITLPFFNSKSMNIIAYVVGVIYYLENINNQKLSHE